MDLNLSGLTLHVSDVERSLTFYKQLPGAQLMFHIPGRFALLRFGGARLALLYDNKRPFHLEFECADLDGMFQTFRELGIRTEGSPTARPWGERDFVLLDPDGNLVEVGQQHRSHHAER